MKGFGNMKKSLCALVMAVCLMTMLIVPTSVEAEAKTPLPEIKWGMSKEDILSQYPETAEDISSLMQTEQETLAFQWQEIYDLYPMDLVFLFDENQLCLYMYSPAFDNVTNTYNQLMRKIEADYGEAGQEQQPLGKFIALLYGKQLEEMGIVLDDTIMPIFIEITFSDYATWETEDSWIILMNTRGEDPEDVQPGLVVMEKNEET